MRIPKLCYLVLFLFISQVLFSQSNDSALFSQLHFRFIGPDGNRAIAVAGVPGNPLVSYVGAASGGIFKTEDGGFSWRPIFDEMDNSSIGALAIAPSNPKQVWAGTGETFLIRPAHAVGNGVYKSTDAGKTWKNTGLQQTFRISRVIVDPTDSNTVYVGALGHAHGPQQERGVYKTTDGGKTWQRMLFVNENTGCSDLSIDPKNPQILFAAMWQVDIKTWNLNSGGTGSGIYRSKDGGKTWEPLRNGLPGGTAHPVGKTSVDVAYSNPKTVYALIEDKDPGLYRSDDGGDNWQLVHQNNSLAQRAPYYTRVRVSTQDEKNVYTISVTIMESKDGGKTFNGNGDYRPGGDNHDMWFDPTNANRMMVAHDGCLNMTSNHGRTWVNINLPIAQMYHVAVDNQIPYNVYGNRQDGYSYRGPSNSLQGGIPLGLWQNVGGCESGFAQPDPFDNNIVWSGCYDGGLDVTDMRTKHVHAVRAWPEAGYGWAPADMKYRWHWNFPMVISKHQKGTVWIGSQYVHQTNDLGNSWKVISPDLTTNEKSHQQSSGGIAMDNLFTFDGCTLYAMAESPVKAGILWTGSNDGLVQLTKDGGKTWANLTANIKGLPKWGTISCISASPFNAGTVYISVDAHQQADFAPYIFKTTDFGVTWKRISETFPVSNASFIHQIIEDPGKKGLLFAGTDNALYFSPDDGATWHHLKNDLPPVPIYGLEVQKDFKDLVIATYGRGFYILDDITPLREYAAAKDSALQLFSVRKSYRFASKQGIHTERSLVSGENPQYGAAINYYLKTPQADSVQVYVTDATGNKIIQLKTKNKTGVNRIWWDLGYEDFEVPKLRTRPKGKDWVKLDSAGKRAMVFNDLDIGPGLRSPLVLPGTYTVVLQVGDKKQTQRVVVAKDPNTKATLEDIKKQHAFAMKLYASINKGLKMVDEMESMRAELIAALSTDPGDRKQKLEALELEIYKMEGQLIDVMQTGARWDTFRNPVQALERLLAISKEVEVDGSDFLPTSQHQQVFEIQNKIVEQVAKKFKEVKEKRPVF
ncbi:MAG: glycosyl hydrolase repeat-containing protein [Flaviaesturariibacter sp.]|nr:glycosyl hydrolase repeat-containing protein [Flaviaesturariibacter sp.]